MNDAFVTFGITAVAGAAIRRMPGKDTKGWGAILLLIALLSLIAACQVEVMRFLERAF